MTAETQKIFFSYAREESDFVLKLAQDLRAAGADLWLDQLDIAAGERWDSAIEEALEACPRMLVVLSPHSVESQNVMDEVSYVLEEGRQVIPVLHSLCKIPFRLRRVRYVGFTDDYEAGFAQLLRDLGIEQPADAMAEPASDTPGLPEQQAETEFVEAVPVLPVADEAEDEPVAEAPEPAVAEAPEPVGVEAEEPVGVEEPEAVSAE